MFLYTNQKLSKSKIRETISFAIESKIIKYLRINLTKEIEDLFIKNYKTLIKKIEEETKQWKSILCSWIGRLNIVKMSVSGN